MKLYDTASRSLQDLSSSESKIIRLYTCGPTVYDKPTIGNWASFIRYDVLARAIRSSGFQLEWVMNITDVGHLVSDADEGEDKLEKGARRESKTAWQIADHYTDYFLKGLDYFNLSIDRKDIVRATDYIDGQIRMVEALEKNGQTYGTEDGIYFDSSTFEDYGKMARLDKKGLSEGFRVSSGGKKHATDFALWKFSPKDHKRDMEWDSPWGTGFPGWHLECSAIILEKLGDSIDIHAGGIEHIPVHHTNEIAQSESVTKKKLARLWVHNNHLKIDGSKISKSLGNGFTAEDLNERGFNGADFRMFVLMSNYRTEANFTWDILAEARQKRLELQGAADLRHQTQTAGTSDKQVLDIDALKQSIGEALANNLNTPEVLALLSGFCASLSAEPRYENAEYEGFLEWLDEVLGLDLLASKDITPAQKQLIEERNKARTAKDWDEADRIRQELKDQDILLNDLAGNTSTWYRSI